LLQRLVKRAKKVLDFTEQNHGFSEPELAQIAVIECSYHTTDVEVEAIIVKS
jgi:hypothetical protein